MPQSLGNFIISIRNLIRQIWVSVDEREPKDREEKIAALRLLVGLALASKLHLRSEAIDELKDLVSPPQYDRLKTITNPP
ncbi:hypothetical protein [Microseira sp. BLCC-F43]|jgi:putative membrane protein|uniref:hypothetical protein n=1 Tax=Microseira sp. BLCC-F43 TaxID=3153602 RepID=UPI0035B6BEAE